MCICTPFINTLPSSFPRWNACRTSRIFGHRATDGYRRPARSLKITLSTSTETAECVRPLLSECHCTVCVRQPPNVKGTTPDLPFQYTLNLEAFNTDSRVPFDRFNYVATCGRVSDYQPFPYTLPCHISSYYCMAGEEADLLLHPKCLYANPPIDCDWMHLVANKKTQFIAKLLDDKKLYCCANYFMLLF